MENTLKYGEILSILTNKSPDVFWIRNTDYTKQIFISPAYDFIWGRPREQLYQNPEKWIDFIHPDDQKKIETSISQRLAANPNDTFIEKYRIIRPNGEIRWIRDTSFAVYENEKHIGFAGIAQDITKETFSGEIATELPKNREAPPSGAFTPKYNIKPYLTYLAEKSRDVFWIRNADYSKQIYISPVYEEVWGRPRQEMYDNPACWSDFLHPEDLQRMNDSLSERSPEIRPDTEMLERYRIIRPDGSIRWIKDTSFPIYEGDKHIGFAGIAQDMTEEVIHHKKLETALDIAKIANKVKSEFIANMSHDLRTPMTGVMGMLGEMKHLVSDIRKNPKDADEILKQIDLYVDIAKESADELLNMFNDILETIKVESGKIDDAPEHFMLKNVIDKNVTLLKSTANHKGLKLSTRIGKKVPQYLFGLRKPLDRILVNLLSNALKFTDEGSITISAEVKSKKPLKLGENTLIRLCVEDTGIGIPQDKFETIFEHFSRLTSSYEGVYKGSGLGLYAVKNYVSNLGGRIWVESLVGRGSRFIAEIPFAVSDHEDKNTEAEKEKVAEIKEEAQKYVTKKKELSTPQNSGTYHALLTEDNPAAAMAVTGVLKRFGCSVDHALTGKKGIELASNHDYDIIFMDIGLPDMTGLDACKAIRALNNEKRAQVPIVALTGHVDKLDICLEAGMQDLQTKPAQPEAIQQVLQRFVQKKEKKTEEKSEKTHTILDWENSLALANGNIDSANAIIKACADDLKKSLPILEKSYDAIDLKALREELHRIEGGVCYIRAPELRQTIESFHEVVNQNPKTHDHMKAHYFATKHIIDRFCQEVDKRGIS